jgi:hypothetical protein
MTVPALNPPNPAFPTDSQTFFTEAIGQPTGQPPRPLTTILPGGAGEA